MRRSFTLLLICTVLLWSAAIHAAVLGELGYLNGANDNPHNLSSRQTGSTPHTTELTATATQICVFCHTPHGATPNSTLWGRPDPDGPLGGFLTFEQNRVRDGSGVLGIAEATIVLSSKYGPPYEYPNGASKLCLSCHDGVTALGVTVRGVDILVSGSVGNINLATSHPISFYYTDAIATAITALPKSAAYKMPNTTIVPLDWAERVQCTICHEPHFDTKQGTYDLPFWRNAGSDSAADYLAICIQCHIPSDYYKRTDGTSHNIPVVP